MAVFTAVRGFLIEYKSGNNEVTWYVVLKLWLKGVCYPSHGQQSAMQHSGLSYLVSLLSIQHSRGCSPENTVELAFEKREDRGIVPCPNRPFSQRCHWDTGVAHNTNYGSTFMGYYG